ncbi:ferrous iron transport protein A [Hymenobacter sp. BT175]|uniref:FeoA family protein n=1 Tax=Hymenobacter translucens TaxID=2886507 RepID=UPI001D0E1FDE|nr:FeoA family protein [Hymenobacter translucens]MCC2546097.1 ferrous iron transport protein A [Hymenobacter translucens]
MAASTTRTTPQTRRSVKDLRVGESGTICCLQDPEMALKLLEMGCIPGTRIRMNSRAPLGCPVTLVLGDDDYTLSVRVSEAATILLKD